MQKISKNELVKIIQEEYERAIRKQKLTQKLNSLNEEISKLEEVEAGAEMSGDVHDGQKTPEFDLKGSHIVEEGLENHIHFKGDEIYFIDHKIGSFVNGEPSIDPMYADKISPAVMEKIKTLKTSVPALAECDSMPAESGPEFESVPSGEEAGVIAPEGEEKAWMFEGKERMLRLGGLLNED